MKIRPIIKAFILRALRRRDGEPATEQLIVSVVIATFPRDITESEVTALLSDMTADGDLVAATHPVLQTRSYALSTAGNLAAQQLG